MPPSTQGTIIFPGFDGGGSGAGRRSTRRAGLLYVNANEMPWILTMVRPSKKAGTGPPPPASEPIYLQNCAACHGAERKGDPTQSVSAAGEISKKLTREAVQRHHQARARA